MAFDARPGRFARVTRDGTDPNVLPRWALVHLAHAAAQASASAVGVDLLHVKGPAVDARLRPGPVLSTDADVLVRPAHVSRFTEALRGDGWTMFAGFEAGSAWRHAAGFYHPSWGNLDVHRAFPGLGPDPVASFDRLWRDHGRRAIAGRECPVPDYTGQALVILLHSARTLRIVDSETAHVWGTADQQQRARIRALADELGAQVGLAAAIGELEDFPDAADHDLWQHFRDGGSRLAEWRARVRAARSPAEAAREVGRALVVNTDHLAMRLGRVPSRPEVVREAGRRVVAAGRELARTIGRRTR